MSDWVVAIEPTSTPTVIPLFSPSGPPGPAGVPGATGAVGTAGAAGATWRDGTGAPSNSLGADGDYYLNDATGDVYKRTTGTYSIVATIKGPAGATGSVGATGTQGPQGVAGSTGAQGPQGATGATGAAGTPGSVWREGSGAPSNSTGIDGDFYLNGTNGDVYQRASGVYAIVANIKGPTGAAGAAGAAGSTGATGTTGATGPTGAAGAAATITAGTATGLAAGASPTVSNSGTSSAATFNFGIPAGATGAAGATGSAGAPGPTGPTGSSGAMGATGPSGVVAATAPLTYNSGTQTVAIPAATDSVDGYMTAAEHTQVTSNTSAISAETTNRTNADALLVVKTANLSDLGNAGTARGNLGLGTAAVKDIPASGNASATQVVSGSDTRLGDSRAPSGTAGGDLTGSYPNPTVAALAITDAKVASANKDGLAAVASLRTLGTGATQAAAGNDGRLSDARTPTTHQSTHQSGSTDVLTGTLDATARHAISQAGALVGTRRGLNFIGRGTVVADNSGSERVDMSRDDPATMIYLRDDFIGGSSGNTVIGELGWSTAGGTTTYLASIANHPGMVRRDTSSTSATLAALYIRGTAGAFVPTDTFDLLFIVRLNTNDANTTVRVGLATSATTNASDGLHFEKLDADTNWFAVARNSGTATRTDTTVAVGTGWVVMRVRRKDASTIGFQIGATITAALAATEITLTTNIPTVAQFPFVHILNSAAASKTIDLDYMDLLITGMAR